MRSRLRLLQGGLYVGYELTYATGERCLNLLYVEPANKHDLGIVKEGLINKFKSEGVILNKI
ncbi:MAG: hypothetical protein QW186_07490 [Candidatus Bathyarchaeia archaeon]